MIADLIIIAGAVMAANIMFVLVLLWVCVELSE